MHFSQNREGCESTDMVPLSQAKTHCPGMVVDYLAGLITWVKKNEKQKK